ncbi:type III-B CRISPR module-associated protein Cmr5 [Thermotoga sp. SG1]|uniref:type III-B CRISPR module-associated protein Cmr5 n=1 Tax=Thermotoga sp. SG1 TaxID=126739 RepID=UPI000C77BF67|nr:type III-B CRISPR module-associated protein Cmr5 [Thermotoga sp. SG1]PLV57160.1 type III-B CRISPR module-associated protein Cmr5 [Thermotoga sp. SG1]
MEILSLKLGKKAMELVREISENDKVSEKEKDDYLKTVKKLGSLIVQNGILGAMIFLEEKKKNTVLNHLKKLIEEMTGIGNLSEDMMNNIDIEKYLKIQIAALEASKWLKRCAEILIGGEKNESSRE